MKPVTLFAAGAVLQVIVVVVFVALLVRGVNIVQESGGLKAIVESVWCGNGGCDSK